MTNSIEHFLVVPAVNLITFTFHSGSHKLVEDYQVKVKTTIIAVTDRLKVWAFYWLLID